MKPLDFTPYFNQYEALVAIVDNVFDRVKNERPENVKCKIECADCCHALFDLTLIEAIYINHHFNSAFDGAEKEKLLEIANRADRLVYKIKRRAYRDFKKGVTEIEILEALAEERVRCPLLGTKNRCHLYAFRPITCRLYGIPTSIQETGHTCGLSGFVEGEAYPTVKLDVIQRTLFELSSKLIQTIKSKHIKMADMLVPLSMALITVYDDEYLGVSKKGPDQGTINDQAKGD